MKKGYTVTELLLVIGVFAVLIGFASLNLFSLKAQASLATTADILVSDLKTAQIKAMAGDPTGDSIRFLGNRYAMYGGVYAPGAPEVALGDFVTVTTSFGDDLTFARLSGETTAGTITLTNAASGEQKTVTINELGVVTNVN